MLGYIYYMGSCTVQKVDRIPVLSDSIINFCSA